MMTPAFLFFSDAHGALHFYAAAADARNIFVVPGRNYDFASNMLDAYPKLVRVFFYNILDHVGTGFHKYYYITLRQNVTFPEALALWHNAKPDDAPATGTLWMGMEYPITTMASTAYATTLWVSFCAATLIGYRTLSSSIVAARRAFIWSYDHPNMLLVFCVACLPACLITGAFVTWMWL